MIDADTASILDTAELPIEELAALAVRESHRPRPVYTAHKWFARRFGTAMRALIVASTVRDRDAFWPAFLGDADLTGSTVADLFIGGGTSLFEAKRLGASVVGADIDPVACLVTEFELNAHTVPDPLVALGDVVDGAADVRALYRTVGRDGQEREVVHFLWVQRLQCGSCAEEFDAHPTWRVALDSTEQKREWVLCRGCGELHRLGLSRKLLRCDCGTTTVLDRAPLVRGKATCPACGHAESLIQYARRTGERPEFRMFAIESIGPRTGNRVTPIRERLFHKPAEADLDRYAKAQRMLAGVADQLPTREIPQTNRSDSRITSYGYTRYTQLFNDRQLLHLATLIGTIAGMPEGQRLGYALAMSNHLTSNCMLTRYSAKYRQATPLFALRSFTHSARPVELNPWLRGIGRGTFPNAVRKVAAAVDFAKSPRELHERGFVEVATRADAGTATVINGDSRNLSQIASGSAQLILTDPPYLDNIDYSELADFFVPWLAATGQIEDPGAPDPASLAAKKRDDDSVQSFKEGLTLCFSEGARILAPGGRMVFTFQHGSSGAWDALSSAMSENALRIVQLFPMRGDSDASPHRHENSTTWDAVFVLTHADRISVNGIAGAGHLAAAAEHARAWSEKLGLGAADHRNFERASIAAAGAGFLAPENATRIARTPTLEALRQAEVRRDFDVDQVADGSDEAA